MQYHPHPRNKPLIAKLEGLGFTRRTRHDGAPFDTWFDKGTARVWFEDIEADHVVVMHMNRPSSWPEWKVTLESAPVALIEEAIKTALA